MLDDFIAAKGLPAQFKQDAQQWFIPIADAAFAHQKGADRPLFFAINGCQGSGKSTLSAFLQRYWQAQGKHVVNLSLDDFYLSQPARSELSQQVHPLFKTRGVPGTHNIPLLENTLENLAQQRSTPLPRFDKSQDNPLPEAQWQSSPKHVDVVIFEGWCWGVAAQPDDDLAAPVNPFEQSEDTQGTWRRYANEQLRHDYQPLYSQMDCWLMLKAPDFACVQRWRWQQEQMLAQQNPGAPGLMSEAQVQRFIQHYQRLTEHGLATLPQRCNWVLQLDSHRRIHDLRSKEMQ